MHDFIDVMVTPPLGEIGNRALTALTRYFQPIGNGIGMLLPGGTDNGACEEIR